MHVGGSTGIAQLCQGGGSQGVPRFAKPTEGLSESGGLLGAQLPGSHAVPWQGAGCHLLAGPVPDRHSPMGKGLLRAAPGAAMPVGRGHAGRGWSTELSCALLREVEGAASARLTQNVPLPGAHSTGMEAATPPHTHTSRVWPHFNGAWHHMVHALFVLPPLGKQGRGSLSAAGGGTQRGAVPVSRVPPARRSADPQHPEPRGAPTRSAPGTQRDSGGWEERVAAPNLTHRSTGSDPATAMLGLPSTKK